MLSMLSVDFAGTVFGAKAPCTQDALIESKKAHASSSHNRQHIAPVEEEVLRVRNGFMEHELPRVVCPVRAVLEILFIIIRG